MASEGTSLKKGRLGVFGIVFFVVAASAPLVGMTGAVPVAMVLGNGAATPGAYLAAVTFLSRYEGLVSDAPTGDSEK